MAIATRTEIDICDQEEVGSEVPKTLTFWNGLALVIGLQIGSGIFSSPAVIASKVTTQWGRLSVWLVAGFLIWTGASSFIELGINIPKNGGIQEYLHYCYSDSFAFTFAWIWIGLVKPCSTAMISLIFSEYVFKAATGQDNVPIWILKGVAFLAVVVVTLANCLGTTIGAGAANVFLVLKFATLISIVAIGFALSGSGFEQGTPRATPPHSDIWASVGAFTDAVFAALFAYGGWENISYVVGEMKDPHKDLPRVLNTAMISVISLFMLVNVALFLVVSPESTQDSNTIALDFARKALGPSGELIYAGLISICCLGAINANIFAIARLTQAAGKRNYLPGFISDFVSEAQASQQQQYQAVNASTQLSRLDQLKKWRAGQHVPFNALIFNMVPTACFIAAGDFRVLLSLKGMTEYLIYAVTVAGIFALRKQIRNVGEAGNPGRYRTCSIFPLVFCFIATALAVRGAILHAVAAFVIAILFGATICIHRLIY